MPIIAEGGWVTWKLWDSKTLGAADVTTTLFQQPKGAVAGKTKRESNMQAASQLPKGQNFKVLAYSWWVKADMTAANLILLADGYWEFHVSDKVMAEDLFMCTPSGGGPSSDVTASVELNRMGVPDARNLLTVTKSFTIEWSEQFEVRCYWPNAPGAIEFFFGIHGELQRPLN